MMIASDKRKTFDRDERENQGSTIHCDCLLFNLIPSEVWGAKVEVVE